MPTRAYTDAKYVKFANAPCPPELSGGTFVPAGGQTPGRGRASPGALSPRQCDISGQRLPGVSKWAFSYGAEANTPVTLLGKEGQVYVGVDGNYRSHWNSNASPSIYTDVKGYALTNFRAGFRGDGFDVFGWVRNAFDVELYRDAAGRAGQHRPDRRPAGRSADLGRHDQVLVLSGTGIDQERLGIARISSLVRQRSLQDAT